MTNREFYSAIARGEISPEIQEHAEMLLAKMDEQNAKRKSVMTKKQQENEAVKQDERERNRCKKMYCSALLGQTV